MFAKTLDEALSSLRTFQPTLTVSVGSPDEARDVLAKHGDLNDVLVDVPSIDRLRHAHAVLYTLLPMVKDRGWIVDSAYMLKDADSLNASLAGLCDEEISGLLEVFSDAINYYLDLQHGDGDSEDPYAGPPMEVLFPPLLDVVGTQPTASAATSALLSVLDDIEDDAADAAATTLLHALHGKGDGDVRAASLREVLTELRRKLNKNCQLAVSSSNHLVCWDLAVCCTKLTKAMGVLLPSAVNAGNISLVVEVMDVQEIAACVARLQRLQAKTDQFRQALNHIMDAPVSFNANARCERCLREKRRFVYGDDDLSRLLDEDEDGDGDEEDEEDDNDEEEDGDDEDDEDEEGEDDDANAGPWAMWQARNVNF